MAIHAALRLLPAGLQELDVAVQRCGPLLQHLHLQRFSQLRTLRILSDVGYAEEVPHVAAVAEKLSAVLFLFGRNTVPARLPAALAAATQLASLDITVIWDGNLDSVCRALPALKRLR